MDTRHSVTTPPTLEELKKLIKQESITTGRLQSLRLPRDLSLGGTKPKKVYTPNLNAIRNKDKNKHAPVKVERGQKRRGDNHHLKSSSSRDQNKRFKYVQSEGVFSHGMGETKRPTYHAEKTSLSREHVSAAALVMPTINKTTWNMSKKEVAEILGELVADDDILSDSDTEFDPVVLPLDLNKENFAEVFKIKTDDVTSKIKNEDIKVEKDTGTTKLYNGYSDVKIKMESIDYEPEQFTSFTDSTLIYDEDNPAFSVLQLPTSFSGKVFRDDPNNKNLDYTIWDVPEGQLGRIIVRKSGKMELIVKNTKYMLNGRTSDNLQETLMLFPGEESIAIEPSVVTLGTIDEKFTVTPEWNTLFNRAKQRSKFYW